MSEHSFLIPGVEAVTRVGAAPLSIPQLLVSNLLLFSGMLISWFGWSREPIERSGSAWPPPEGVYWGM